jgi:glycine/D-amino acid oxidase-like deaminating enzyme
MTDTRPQDAPHWAGARHQLRTVELPRTADVAVIGGGLVGVCTALALAESGRRPVVIEAERLAARASGRNGGLLIPCAPESFTELTTRWGRATALVIQRAYDAGGRQLVQWIEEHSLACQWRPEGALRAAASAREAAVMAAETVDLVASGLDAAWVEVPDLEPWLPGLRTRGNGSASLFGAQVLAHGGAFHSGLLVTALARRAVDLGGVVVEEEPVVALEEDRHGVTVHTGRGRLSADEVVVATNAQLATVLPELGALVTPVRGQVLATEPLAPGLLRGAWSVNDGYEYAQQLADGTAVAGGMRWAAADREIGLTEATVNPAIQGRIDEWLTALLSRDVRVARRWAGIMAFTEDRLPFVGRVPESERVLVAAAFNGHGVPAAPMAAGVVRALVNGETPGEVAMLLGPGRLARPAAP